MTSISARVMVNAISSGMPSRSISRVTSVPSGPLMSEAAWAVEKVRLGASSMAAITSPGCRPAFWAGEPFMGAMMESSPPVYPMVAPIPL